MEEEQVLSQWMDRKGHLLTLPVNIVHPKTAAQVPRAGWECVGWCYRQWREGSPTASPMEIGHGQPWPHNIKLKKNHSQIFCKTLLLETSV